MSIKSLFSRENRELAVRYIYISLFGYGFVFFALYLLVEVIFIDKRISFLIAYGLWYVFLYFIQLKILFKVSHNRSKFIRFCFYLIFFYLIANIFYNTGIFLGLNYMISTLITVTILVPFRFIVAKLLVFKD